MSTTPRPPGIGRVAFIARLGAIREQLAGGDYMTTIYQRHAAELGITYSAFRKLVARYAPDARPGRRPYGSAVVPVITPSVVPEPPPAPAPTPRAVPTPAAPPSATGIPGNARHDPGDRPTFVHDGRTKEGEPERLFGPGYLPGSRK